MSGTGFKVELSAEAAQLLWAVAMDDDDLAGYVAEICVLSGATQLCARMEDMMGATRVERIRRLERDCRIRCLRGEEEAGSKFAAYLRNEEAFRDQPDDIPF